MQLPSTYLRRASFALAAAAMISGTAAQAQSVKALPVNNAPSVQTVSQGQCAAFGSYLMDESDTFGTKLSSIFLDSVSRFIGAKCATRDAKGEIQIIIMNNQDGASFRTARGRMGTFDILAVSGVKACIRPEGGVCSTTTSSNTLKAGGG